MTTTLNFKSTHVPAPACAMCRHKYEPPAPDPKGWDVAARRPMECHRFPPTPAPVFVNMGTGVPPSLAGTVSVYPPVQPDQLCGEYELSPAVLS